MWRRKKTQRITTLIVNVYNSYVNEAKNVKYLREQTVIICHESIRVTQIYDVETKLHRSHSLAILAKWMLLIVIWFTTLALFIRTLPAILEEIYELLAGANETVPYIRVSSGCRAEFYLTYFAKILQTEVKHPFSRTFLAGQVTLGFRVPLRHNII